MHIKTEWSAMCTSLVPRLSPKPWYRGPGNQTTCALASYQRGREPGYEATCALALWMNTCFSCPILSPLRSELAVSSLVPRLSWNANMHRVESLVSFSTPAQLQCLRSQAWEPGNKAKQSQVAEDSKAFLVLLFILGCSFVWFPNPQYWGLGTRLHMHSNQRWCAVD